MDTARIEVRLRDLAQLFNSLDPSPFSDRDLAADAEAFILGWSRELPSHAEFELVVHLATEPDPERAAGAEEAVRHYFASRAAIHRRELRQLLRRGRASLVIGLVFLAACFALGLGLLALLPGKWGEFGELGVQIVGWVAMWRPLEIFLYDWWPVRAEVRLAERLARMKVSLRVGDGR